MIQIKFREDNANIMLDSLYTSILQLLSNIYYFEHEFYDFTTILWFLKKPRIA